jgi:AbrB family looped-hinge helix DNA binding protein
MATTLTSKGQVTIPKRVRELLGLKPGSAVEFELSASGEIVVRPTGGKRPRPASRFERLRGRATVRMRTEEILALTRAPG